MAKQRKLSPKRKAFINNSLEHYQPTNANDVQEMLKDLLGDTLQGMLEADIALYLSERFTEVLKNSMAVHLISGDKHLPQSPGKQQIG